MREKVSVAMATYNGEKYIKGQIDSILNNLLPGDELIISDDGSTDSTIDIVNEYMKKDKRIKLFFGPKKGPKQNFANAISKCTGKYIFLADQDDYWVSNKVEIVISNFIKYNALLIQHDCRIINFSTKKVIEPSFFEFRKCGPGVLKNIIKTTYIGCCMAFDSSIKNMILPIPDDIDMHDQWIGIIADHYKKSVFINDKLIDYQRHEGTASDCFHHYPLLKMLRNRIVLIYRYLRRIIRRK